MALSMLVSNADCGPSNGLQNLSKRFEQDRSYQQDRIVKNGAGSSREGFRSQQSSQIDQDVARFFGSPLHGQHAFNLSDIEASLPALTMPQAQHQRAQNSNSSWATDFLLASHSPAPQIQASELATRQPVTQVPGPQGLTRTAMTQPQYFGQHIPMNTQYNQMTWDREFASQEQSFSTPQETVHSEAQAHPIDQDELARTAGMLLESVKEETNPKFHNSTFMGLMQQLRDREVTVEGNQMVEHTSETSYAPGSSSSKGKERAMESLTQTSFSPVGRVQSPLSTCLPNHANLLQQIDEVDAYLRRENDDYMQFWNEAASAKGHQNPPSTEWDHLQHDWDRFEAMETGIRPIDPYQFQINNPYLLGDSVRSRHHAIHEGQRMSIFESVLELEAIVQRDPTNVRAWHDLGVKQQENEREQKALQALSMAVEIDPKHLSSWLALAVSHTNDGNKAQTFGAVYEWAKKNTQYAEVARAHLDNMPPDITMWNQETSRQLIQCLMSMARMESTRGIDADVQIALAVLFNSGEDYEKASDCFRTALAVRPEDWLLYNRVGATMANDGHAGEALDYYYRALEMNPSYVRARFNLGISCITLKRYAEAAQHILDALVLQESDAAPEADTFKNDKRGLMSRALWDSLKTACLHMQRLDLAILCDQRDLENFRERFV